MIDRTDLPKWHRVAAREKCDSIMQLAPEGVERIVEIGCGSGAVLEELDRREFGVSYWACEPTRSLYDAIPGNISRLVATSPEPFDAAFLDEPKFDLGIMTHVAEHLRTPAILISEALARCEFLVVEVPIEDSFLGRNRVRVKQLMGRSRLDNPAGHVQFFSRNTARALISHAGGRVIAERAYFPMAAVSGSADRAYQKAVVQVASRSAWLGRRYYEHFAMLVSAVHYDDWPGHYIPPK